MSFSYFEKHVFDFTYFLIPKGTFSYFLKKEVTRMSHHLMDETGSSVFQTWELRTLTDYFELTKSWGVSENSVKNL